MPRSVMWLYYISFLAIVLEAGYAVSVSDWFMFKVCIGGFIVAALTYGPPSYFRRVVQPNAMLSGAASSRPLELKLGKGD